MPLLRIVAIFCLLYSVGSAQMPTFELELPERESPSDFTWLEWSTDLTTWTPVARDYGNNWENTFPHVLPLSKSGDIYTLIDEIDESQRFYRVRSASASSMALNNQALASRFLQQATFGPTLSEIQNFPGINTASGFNDAPYSYFEAWIDSEIAKPVSSHRAFWRERSNPNYTTSVAGSPFPDSPYEVANTEGHLVEYRLGTSRFQVPTTVAVAAGRSGNDVRFTSPYTRRLMWYDLALNADDALRQRVAWCFAQIFVIGQIGSTREHETESFLKYYDIFVRHAFGNFRDILGEVTFSPRMGNYLTYTDNRKANSSNGTYPDENYAREIMQLFTIGLWELNMDGSQKLDSENNPIPTYDNEDIEEIARIFTGMRRQPARTNVEILDHNLIDPMRIETDWNDHGEKIIFDGDLHIRSRNRHNRKESNVIAEINHFLDYLVGHTNTPPFIARLLIQRLTVSNPSPNYIQSVAEAFASGLYNGVGTGDRGDLTATIKAILLHPEAREPALGHDAAHGKLREPLIRLLHYARAFNITSTQTNGFFPFSNMLDEIGQEPHSSPTVFNFYLSDFQPNGEVVDRGLMAPEFQIHNDSTAIAFINVIKTLVDRGIEGNVGYRGFNQGELDLSYEISMADDSEALLDHLDIILTAGRLTQQNRDEIKSVIDLLPAGTDNQKRARVRKALWLFCFLPEFNIIY